MSARPRASGVQLHVSSLPGGRLGVEAYRFVDWLVAAGQTWWQVLPLSPPDRYRSPYKSRSAFAASPALLAAPRARVSAARGTSVPRARGILDRGLDPASAAAMRWPTRSASTGSGGRCATTPTSAGFGCLAMSRSTSAPGSVDHRSHPGLFRRARWRARRRTRSRISGSCGATRSTTGRRCDGTATAGGWSGFAGVLGSFDAVRLDHFRGFVAYWAVPEGRPGRPPRAVDARARTAVVRGDQGELAGSAVPDGAGRIPQPRCEFDPRRLAPRPRLG